MTKKTEISKTKKALKTLSRWLGGILFSLALLLLFTNLFASALVNNTDILKESLSEEITDSNIFVDQILENSEGTTEEEIRIFCNQNPNEELCKVLDNPGEAVADSFGFDELEQNLEPVKEGLNSSRIIIGILFFLGLLFNFLGRISFYRMMFRMSRSVFIESTLWLVLFDIFPGSISTLFDLFVPQNSQIPTDLLVLISDVVDKWFDIALSSLKEIMIWIIAISVVLTITFYFLNKRSSQP